MWKTLCRWRSLRAFFMRGFLASCRIPCIYFMLFCTLLGRRGCTPNSITMLTYGRYREPPVNPCVQFSIKKLISASSILYIATVPAFFRRFNWTRRLEMTCSQSLASHIRTGIIKSTIRSPCLQMIAMRRTKATQATTDLESRREGEWRPRRSNNYRFRTQFFHRNGRPPTRLSCTPSTMSQIVSHYSKSSRDSSSNQI
jgi:hypothetical protein